MIRRADERLSNLLAECADLIQDGGSVSACLARYPEDAAELEPLLLALVELRQVRPVPPRAPAVAQQSRAQFILAAQQMGSAAIQPAGRLTAVPAATAAHQSWLARLAAWLLGDGFAQRSPVGAGALAFLLLVLIGGLLLTGVTSAAESTLPGDWLYPLKTTVEDLRLTLMRDPLQRDVYESILQERRLLEARTIADTGRKVRSLALQGEITALHRDRWIVSELEVLIDRNTRIIGVPVIGATVNGTMRAPGDHTLVAVYVEVEPPTGAAPALAATPTIPPTPTRVPPTVTPSPSPSTSPTAPVGGGGVPAVYDEPEDPPSPRPSLTPTQTATLPPTATRTARPTATVSATPTELPKPQREQVKGRLIGYVERIEGSWWTIEGKTVECDSNTVFSGNPDVGALVEAVVEITPEGRYIGLSIRRIGEPNPLPEPVEFTDVVKSINGEWWSIGDYTLKVTGETTLENNPGVGDMVSVKAERRAGGEIVALRITALRAIQRDFNGVIESMSGSIWVISGTPVTIDGATEIRGTPEIGSKVQVSALEHPDGRLVATLVAVVDPPTATETPVTAEAETATPEPLTATPEPPTATPEPPTATPETTTPETETPSPEAPASPTAEP
jgi:hypothetical protein